MKILEKLKVIFNRKEITRLVIMFFGVIAMSLLETFGVASIVPFMSVIANPDIVHENEYFLMVYRVVNFDNDVSFIIMLGVLVIILLILSNISQGFMFWKITSFANSYRHKISMQLLKKYLDQPYLFFLNKNTADLGKNILSEIERSVSGLILPVMMALSRVVVVLLLTILIFIVNPIVSIAMIVVLSSSYWIIFKIVGRKLSVIGSASTVANTGRYKIANEALSGIKDIKLRGGEEDFLYRFSGPSRDHANYTATTILISSLPRYALESIAFSGIVLISLLYIAPDGSSSKVIPVISLYALAGYRLMPALQQIYANITQVKYNYSAFNLLIDDLMLPSYKEDNLCSALPFEEHIKVKNVSFYYPDTSVLVLDKVNITISPNTTIGLVGTTGSGKTTLVDIIIGLLPPNSGSISVDGVIVNSQNLYGWQRNIGYVPQAIYLTDDTIANNIAFAVPEEKICMQQVMHVAKLAQIDDFVNSLHNKYDTNVGDRGIRMSGGQRQRIGIARALYLKPTILVLDEATSALDSITEQVIIETIRSLSHKITIIMIAHRLSTVRECDTIYVMDKGNIVDSGTYSDLIESNLKFRQMANN